MRSSFARIPMLFALLIVAFVPNGPAQTAPAQPDSPAKIFEDGRNEFFATINKFVAMHPRRSDLSGDDVLRLHEARQNIPYLFERVMNIAWQKDAPLYSEWLRKGDAESLKFFRKEFLDLSREYGARFVGSLFREENTVKFSRAMPHNRGKSRLELVLQTLGYNAKNEPAPVPPEQRYANKIGPEFYSQWTVAALNATKAQQLSKGAGVIVAVIDSGLDPYNSLFKDKTVPGFTFLQRTKAPWEEEEISTNTVDWGWHGTVVASEIMLVAPECRLMPIRALDGDTMNDPVHGYWAYELFAAAVYYAVNHGAHVINISAPMPSSEPVLWQAIRYAYSKNVVVSTGAGNVSRSQWGVSNVEKMYRSFDHELLLVGGVEHRWGKYIPWQYSLPGPQVTVAVPADKVFMIAPIYAPDLKNDYGSGTSLAAPQVSGVVALMRSAAPPSPDLLAKPGAYVKLVKAALTETARLDVLGLADRNDIVGNGLVDAEAAIKKIKQLMVAPRAPIKAK
ncbi:MAG: S8 family serine peptidase [Terriglobales bacterium]